MADDLLKPGDTVTGPCQAVDHSPVGLLGLDGSGLLRVVPSGPAALKGRPLLASRKQAYLDAFTAQGLAVCADDAHKFAVAGAPLELSLGPSGALVWFCGWDWVDASPVGATGLVFARACEAAMKNCLNGKKGVALYAGGGSSGSGSAFSHFGFFPAGWPAFAASLNPRTAGTAAQNFLNDAGTVGGHSLKDCGLLLVDCYFEEVFDYTTYMGPITAAAANINRWLLGGGALVAVSEIMDLTDYGPPPGRDGLPILHGFSWVPVAVPGVQCYVDYEDSAATNPRALTAAGRAALPALTDAQVAAMTDTSQSCFATGGASITAPASGGFQTVMAQRGRNCVIAGRLPGTKAPTP